MFFLPVLLTLLLPGQLSPPFDHVLIISVDGMRGDALGVWGEEGLPVFHSLWDVGTVNARTDPLHTKTMPNHTGMMTGRLAEGEGGHGWLTNRDDPDGGTLQENLGGALTSFFDVAHSDGVRTYLFGGKGKFDLFTRSWQEVLDVVFVNDLSDIATTEVENGMPLDEALLAPSEEVVDALLERWDPQRRSLVFLHLAAPDGAGHTEGWNLSLDSLYGRALMGTDALVGRVLTHIEGSRGLAGRTALILTSDHGGGAPHRHHDRPELWVDFAIPFLVWIGGDGGGQDLYLLNPQRVEPGILLGDAPIRNSDGANLALALLGLPAIEGSTQNSSQDLRVYPFPAR
ncbi:alkaline phosphatase family protein [bacterium]|nr:alkaline phosphatase family protein [bacterium]